MSVVVQKFGGTSVATAADIRAAARRAIRARTAGKQVVVVVSARGNSTDELVALAHEVHPAPPSRELDMLVSTGEQVSIALIAMAIQREGHAAISFTAAQVGILTDSEFTRARILKVRPERIAEELRAGNIVIVAGFQGVDEDHNITTLGRGGSDTTAVALAAALDAEICEIYTDVDGVFSADPRLVAAARRIARISYDEMLEMASMGAGVLHPRSVELAKKFHVVLHVRNSGHDGPGTVVCEEVSTMENVFVRGCVLSLNEAKITCIGLPFGPAAMAALFGRLAEEKINIDIIIQTATAAGKTDVSFVVKRDDLRRALEVTRGVAGEMDAEDVTSDASIAKVSVVGIGMRGQPGVAARLFAALAGHAIPVQMISTSEIKISCIVAEDRGEETLRAMHEAFNLAEAG